MTLPNKNAIMRIISDIKSLKDDSLRKEKIYIHWNEDNVFNVKALIIGPDDTPYEGGFYFFDIYFPENYPFVPPKVSFMTKYANIRFNPNLYTCGKVCLSILNTWHGPSWTPANTLSSVLMSLLGLVFIKEPLMNEPGHEEVPKHVLNDYNSIIQFYNFKTLLITLKYIHKDFQPFANIVKSYFMENIEKYKKKLNELLQKKQDDIYYCPTYNIQAQCNYLPFIDEIEKYYLYFKNGGNINSIHVLPKIDNISKKELQNLCFELNIKYDNKMLKKDLYDLVDKKMNK